MSNDQDWINSVPLNLQAQVKSLVEEYPPSLPIIHKLCEHFNAAITEHEDKKRKLNPTPEIKQENVAVDPASIKPKVEGQINQDEIIFELPQISFQSPIRKKMNLIFHLLVEPGQAPKPVMLLALPTTYVPEISVHDLSNLIKLCVLLPILGNSTNSSKRNIGLLCFWLYDHAAADANKNDPIICQVNFDQVKKQLIKAGKIPAEAETQLKEMNGSNECSDGIKAINEAIINFLQKQFQLCGIHLINYLPSSSPTKNKLSINTDAGVAVSLKANLINDLVMVEAYKGARDGAILMLTANEYNQPYIIFGFKKPILIFDISKVQHISYSNITRLTFSIIVTLVNEKKDSKVETLEFGMIDQKYFQIMDEFIKTQGINDNSFDDDLREKGTANDNNAASQENPEQGPPADSDDEEEDGTFQVGQEEAESSVDEEYDSNAGSDAESNADDEEDNTKADDDLPSVVPGVESEVLTQNKEEGTLE